MGYRRVVAAISASLVWVACLFSSNSFSSELSASESGFLNRQDVRAFINDISEQHQLDPKRLAILFAEIQSQQTVLDAISRPAEKVLTWAQYRPIFIKQKRIDLGREFMREHAVTLSRAEKEFGVPAKIIAAIIGVETFYGRVTGRHGVLESVATLAFDYPPRAKFFKSELVEFLILSEAENWDTTAIKGSYAGAMGWPQFISSSYRHYAIDFDNDGKRDLFNSVEDVIGSVANYLNKHGWKAAQPIAQPLPVTTKQRASVKALQRKSLKPQIEPAVLNELGFTAWVGYKNFYVITRYNHSAMYALAVFQLGELLTNQPAK